jgi:regulator of sigma E protease
MRLVGATDWFNPDRGFLLEPDTVMFKARTVGEALRLGAEETWDQLTLVVQILHRVGSRQVSIKAFGGPGSIFVHAYRSAKHGLPTLLLFLTMLSANLAVLNILPIPMLDGGHLMFLAYEGIRGKPANERVQIVLSVIGLFLLLALMVFVIGLDINRWILGK